MIKMITSEKKKKVKNELKELNYGIPEIKGSLVMSYSGELIADSLPEDINTERIRIGLRNYTAATHRYLDELDKVETVEYLIGGYTNSYIFITRHNQFLLMVMANKEAKMGLILVDMRSASRRIDTIIRSE